MKTITVYKNGTSIDGQTFNIDPEEVTIEHLAVQVSQSFGPDVPEDLKFYNFDGFLIDQNRHATNQDSDYYYALRNEVFIEPPPSPQNGNRAAGRVRHPAAFDFGLNLNLEEPLVLKLNVGGVMFETLVITLKKDPNSKLARMFGLHGGNYQGLDFINLGNGVRFLDRDPKYFAPILNYLRTGKLIVDPGLSFEGVIEEAIHFNVTQCIPPNWQHCKVSEALAHFVRIGICKEK